MTQENNDINTTEIGSWVDLDGTDDPIKEDDILIECKCGKKWWIDYTPTPDGCEEDVWRLWLDGVPGIWMDVDGNKV